MARIVRHTWILAALVVSGCTFSPLPGVTCTEEGASLGDVTCLDGVWVATTADVGKEPLDVTHPEDVPTPQPDVELDLGHDVAPPVDVAADADDSDAADAPDAPDVDMPDVAPDADDDVCIPETDAELCERVGVCTGGHTGPDNCGTVRTITACNYDCPAGTTCGEDPSQPAACGCFESDAAFCSRVALCGEITRDNKCGVAMTATCGCEPGNLCHEERCEPDTDGDGVVDPIDNCPLTPNAEQFDADEDGVGDACDNCPEVANNDQDDADDDGVGDLCDNCPDVSNPDQTDTNGNGVGDACDMGDCPVTRLSNDCLDDACDGKPCADPDAPAKPATCQENACVVTEP